MTVKTHKAHRKVRTSITSKSTETAKSIGTYQKRNSMKRWKPEPIIDIDDYLDDEAAIDFLFDTDQHVS